MLRSNLERRAQPFSGGRSAFAAIARAKRAGPPKRKAAASRASTLRNPVGQTNWPKGQAIRNGYERDEQQRQDGWRACAQGDPSSQAAGRTGHGPPELLAWAQQGGRGREGQAARSRSRR